MSRRRMILVGSSRSYLETTFLLRCRKDRVEPAVMYNSTGHSDALPANVQLRLDTSSRQHICTFKTTIP
eukprot:scaffold13993_cov428-Alexandrium_tamarense.AAC.10